MRRSLNNPALIFAFLAVLSFGAADTFAQGKGGDKGGNKGGGGAPRVGGGGSVRTPAGGGSGRVQSAAPVRTPSVQRPAPRANPPAVVARPPAAVRPPATTVRPPAMTVRPPATTVRPPAVSVRPPATTVRPPAVTARPPATTVRPPAVTARPPATTVRPPAVSVRPPVNDGRPSLAAPNGTRPGDRNDPGRSAFNPNDPNRRNPEGRVDGSGRAGFGPDGRRVDASANVGARAFSGNSINMGSRTIQFANQDYRPSYNRHPSYYRGYWNGNRSYGAGGFNGGYGSGYGAGYRGGYGPAYGQGYGQGQGNLGLSLAQLGLGFMLGGNSGYGGYGYSPQGWGLGGWGLGSMGYSSGYLPYSNPYYANVGGDGIYNYAQPIPVSYTVLAAAAPAAGVMSANDMLNASVAAFQQNDYDKALDLVDKGVRQYPDDSVLHEFRALVLFARQDFQQSAATIHSVLAVGPGWNWTTMSGLYADIGLYTTQFRALEAYTQQNPENSGSRFLLAYHYMIGGHNDAVAKQLTHVVRLTPSDRVAADLLRMVSPPPTLKVGDPAQPPVPAVAAAPARGIDPASLVGTWNATREGGESFSLVLDNDSNFKWNFAQGTNPPSQFVGKYTMEGNVLALERREGGSMIAQVTPDANGNFNFRLVGAPTSDAGLAFTR
jgi:tetratricopeptide (TPR) repeat protein